MGSEGWGEECMFRGGMEKKWYCSGMELVWGEECLMKETGVTRE